MSIYSRAIVAGFIATGVLSVLMAMKSMIGVMPGLNVIHMLAGMAHRMTGLPASPAVGWLLYFIIGSVLWGIGFALLCKALPGRNATIRGIVFAVLAWLLMMLIVLPVAGAGLFGMRLGVMAPVMTLLLYVIWGAALGITFGLLGRSAVSR